jgi:uncharacterized protein
MSDEQEQPGPELCAERFYRAWAAARGLVGFEVAIAESDLQVFADRDLSGRAMDAIRRVRRDIEMYAAMNDGFLEALEPLAAMPGAPDPVRRMCQAAEQYGVGPMAAVAGTVAEHVGRELLNVSPRVLVENGGDVFFATEQPPVFGLYAGKRSPFTGRVRFRPREMTMGGVCTSSGTVGHSLSFGRTDAVVAISPNTALADAAATAIGNTVRGPDDIQRAIEVEQERGLLHGLIIALGDQLGVWGAVELIEGD